MYILECADGSYYTGSTKNIEMRFAQHQAGEGANHTKKRLPVKMMYFEEFQRIDEAFYREKQVQGWNRKKKEALINDDSELLSKLAMAYRDTYKSGFKNPLNTLGKNSRHSKILIVKTKPNLLPSKPSLLPEALEGNNKQNRQ